MGKFDPRAIRPEKSTATTYMYFTAWTSASFADAMSDFNENIIWFSK